MCNNANSGRLVPSCYHVLNNLCPLQSGYEPIGSPIYQQQPSMSYPGRLPYTYEHQPMPYWSSYKDQPMTYQAGPSQSYGYKEQRRSYHRSKSYGRRRKRVYKPVRLPQKDDKKVSEALMCIHSYVPGTDINHSNIHTLHSYIRLYVMSEMLT